MPNFRRGAEAIAKATEKTESNFRPFVPEIYWQKDGDARYLMFLNPMADIPTVDMIGFIPVKGKKANGETYKRFERVIARTDPAIGEDEDPMVKDWKANPKSTNLAVAVELEPTVEEDERGRKIPTGFEVKMTEYDRKVRDEDGKATDETETVEAPVIGFVQQSPYNFFNKVASYDANDGPIESTPLKITQVGEGKDKDYTVQGYREQAVDLTPLLEFLDGISYLGDDTDELIDIVDAIEDDQEAAEAVGAFLLDKRLEELADKERYDELYDGIDEPFKQWGAKGGSKKSSGNGANRRERKSRGSQRRTRSEDAPADEASEQDSTPAEPEPEEKPKRSRRTRAAKSDDAPKDEPKAEPKAERAGSAKLAELKKRQEARRAKAAA